MRKTATNTPPSMCSGCRWKNIADNAHDPKIGLVIDQALSLIERENPRLKNVLPRNYARPEIDKIRLGEVVEIFNNIDMQAQGEGIDLFGRVYEYCLLKFSTSPYGDCTDDN